jgi:hypothetical protein
VFGPTAILSVNRVTFAVPLRQATCVLLTLAVLAGGRGLQCSNAMPARASPQPPGARILKLGGPLSVVLESQRKSPKAVLLGTGKGSNDGCRRRSPLVARVGSGLMPSKKQAMS